MAKPPKTPPSSDIDGADSDRGAATSAVPDGVDPGKSEDRARAQSRGRPADTKR